MNVIALGSLHSKVWSQQTSHPLTAGHPRLIAFLTGKAIGFLEGEFYP